MRGRLRHVAIAVAVAPLLLVLSGPAAGAQTAPPPPRPRVVLFGDSLLTETSGAVRSALRVLKPGWDVEIQAFPGTGICDWFDELRATDAQAVALEFSGVLFTDCVGRRHTWPEAYLTDARVAARILEEKGIPVLWLGWPRPVGTVESPRLDDTIWHYYEVVAAEFGDRIADPGAALFDPAAFAYPVSMPCLTPQEEGCVDGRVTVRDGDGGHLCPMTDLTGPCPVYSSGVRRYALALARAVAEALPRIAV